MPDQRLVIANLEVVQTDLSFSILENTLDMPTRKSHMQHLA
jgi:hypothetical protein